METFVVNSCLIDSFLASAFFELNVTKMTQCRLFPVHNRTLVPSTKQIDHFVLLICVFRESYHKNSIGTKLIGIESRYSVIIVITHTLSKRMAFIIHIVTSFGQLHTAPSDLCYLFINGIHASCFVCCVLLVLMFWSSSDLWYNYLHQTLIDRRMVLLILV